MDFSAIFYEILSGFRDKFQGRVTCVFFSIKYEKTNFITARWLVGEKKSIEEFIDKNREQIAIDNDGKDVFLPRIQWDIDRAIKDFPDIEFKNVKTFSF